MTAAACAIPVPNRSAPARGETPANELVTRRARGGIAFAPRASPTPVKAKVGNAVPGPTVVVARSTVATVQLAPAMHGGNVSRRIHARTAVATALATIRTAKKLVRTVRQIARIHV